MNGRWRALTGVGVTCTAVSLVSMTAAGQPAERSHPRLAEGVVRAVRHAEDTLSLTIHFQYPERDQVLLIAPPALPAAYASVVESSWQEPCAFEVGGQVRVSQMMGAPLTIEYRGADRSHQPQDRSIREGWQLCYLRLYFDLDRGAETEYGIGLASAVLTGYSKPLHLWIRGPADKVLSAYADPQQMERAAMHYGQPRLTQSVRALTALREKLDARTILAKALPFRYASSERPVGGGWNRFIVAVYDDHAQRPPTKRIDFSSRESR